MGFKKNKKNENNAPWCGGTKDLLMGNIICYNGKRSGDHELVKFHTRSFAAVGCIYYRRFFGSGALYTFRLSFN